MPGETGGVERAPGNAVGISQRELILAGLPPLNVAVELIASLAEILAILEEDARPHGSLDMDNVYLDDTGVLSVDAFGATHEDSHLEDRYALGCIALHLIGGAPFVSPGQPHHEDAVLDHLLGIDLSDLDGAIVGDVQWFLARLLDGVPEHRPDPVEVWRSFIAFADATGGPDYLHWSAAAIDGRGERRTRSLPMSNASIDPGPLDDTLTLAPATRHGTAFMSKDALRTALEDVVPETGGGSKTSYWSREELNQMEIGSGAAPKPRRATGVAAKRQETQIRTPSPTLIASPEVGMGIPDDPQYSRPNAVTAFETVLPEGQASADDERRQFSIDQCLGRGGFGEVYLCTLASAGGIRSQVAVKVLREGIDPRAQAVRRLRDEARVLAALRHPAILSAHELVVLSGRVAMVMEYVAGADLDICLDNADPPPLRALLEILAMTAEALDASHHARDATGAPLKLVHRDIKPSNIRIGLHGQVKVLDFGIATFASDREAKTAVNQVVGTMAYMSPERLAESEDHPAGDIYALAIILIEALAGEPLWGNTKKRDQYRMAMVAEEHDAFIQAAIAKLDTTGEMRALLSKALAHAPGDRYTAAEISRELEDLADLTGGRNLRRWARDHRWPKPDAFEAELVGRTITEGRVVSSSMNQIGPGKVVANHKQPRPPVPPVPRIPPVEPLTSESPATSFGPRIDNPEPAPRKATPAPAPPLGVASLSPAASAPPALHRSHTPLGDIDEPSTSLRWALPVLLLAFALGGVALAGSGALALILTSGQDSDEIGAPAPEVARQAPEAEQAPPSEEPAPADPARPKPRSSKGSSKAVASVLSKNTTPSPEPGPTPALTTATPSQQAPPDVGSCGDLISLEPTAIVGRLEPDKRACLTGLMGDDRLKMTDRQKVGRVLLVDANARCKPASTCREFEALQERYFEDHGRSDADMHHNYPKHLFDSSATNTNRMSAAISWAGRALERKGSWKGRKRTERLLDLHRIRALASGRIYASKPTEKNRHAARDRAVEWAELRRSLNLDATAAFELCKTATGSMKACDKRISTDAVEEKITFLSIPMRAEVHVDGELIGTTPVRDHGLTHGKHQIEIVVGETRSKREILVGAGQPRRWQWVKADGKWKSWQ